MTGAYYLQLYQVLLVVCYPPCVFQNMHSRVPGNPRSATHSSTSTAYTGLLHLLVGACVPIVIYIKIILPHILTTQHNVVSFVQNSLTQLVYFKLQSYMHIHCY